MIIFTWSPVGPAEWAQGLDDVRRELRNMNEPIIRSIEDVMTDSIQRNFDIGGRPRWAPLAAYTIAKKDSADPLIDTGDLERQATSLDAWTMSFGAENQATLDNVDEYGMHQNYGFFNVPFGSEVPARQWALFQPEDEEDIEEVFWDWLEEVLDRSLP